MEKVVTKKNLIELSQVVTMGNKSFPCVLDTKGSTHVLYVYSGHCTLISDMETLKTGPRGIYCIQKNVEYRLNIDNDEHCVIYMLELKNSSNSSCLNVQSLCEKSPHVYSFFINKPSVCCLIGRENIHLTIEEILFEYWQNKLDNKLALRYLLSILFIKMARAFVLHGRPSGIEYVSKAKAYIAENYDQPLSVDIIANYLGISYSYLESIFRQFGKRTIVTHINGVRIDRAVYMLTSSKASITDIAFAVGFNSRQHFTRVFKQRYGCSPMEYRKRYKSYYLNIAHK